MFGHAYYLHNIIMSLDLGGQKSKSKHQWWAWRTVSFETFDL